MTITGFYLYFRSREEGREGGLLTYEAVEEIDLEFTRPIIILGPMKISFFKKKPGFFFF